MPTLREIAASLNYRYDVQAVMEHHDGRVIDDVTPHLMLDGCSIERDNCNAIHGTARLRFDRELPWSSHRIRLSIISTDLNTGESVTTPAGVWLMETPARQSGQRPIVWQVDCFDLLTLLDTAPSNTVSVAHGTNIQTACQAVADMAGAGVRLNLAGVTGTVRGNKTWPLADDLRIKDIIDELLISAAGRELWVDAEGDFVSDEWIPINTVPSRFEMDGVTDEAILGQKSDQAVDTWGLPNRWVVIADLPGEGTGIPTEGNGLVTIDNVNVGPSSQLTAGRIRTSVVKVDAVNQAALEIEAQRIREESQRPAGMISLCTVPAPLFWHRDVVDLSVPGLGLDRAKHVIRKWTLPLDGGVMKIVAAGV